MGAILDPDSAGDSAASADPPLAYDMIQWEYEDCFYVVLHPAFQEYRYDSREQAERAIANHLEGNLHEAREREAVDAQARLPRLRPMLLRIAAALRSAIRLRAPQATGPDVPGLLLVALPQAALAALAADLGWSLGILC